MNTLKLSSATRTIAIGRPCNMSLSMGRRIVAIARAAGRHQPDRAAVTATIIQMARDLYYDHLSDAAITQLRQITHRTNQDRTNQDRTMSDTWLEMVWPAGTDM